MRILVTGGAGYIGSHLAHQLADAGHELVVLDNLYSGHRWAVPESARFIEGDVGDRDLVTGLLRNGRFESVMHFAAHIEVGESVENPAKYYRNNTALALTLFEACRDAEVPKLIFSSTAAVYGEPKRPATRASEKATQNATQNAPDKATGKTTDKTTEKSSESVLWTNDDGLISEDAPIQPMNPYGSSKAMSERILQDICNASGGATRFIILRYFNVAGARLDGKIGQATPRATHLIKVAAEAALGLRDKVTIFGTDYATFDGTCLRDYIHVEDLASAHLDALEYLNAGGSSDIFNVGYGRPFSVREVLRTMRNVSGREFAIAESGRRPGDPSAIAAASAKIRRVLGWAPKHDSLELICETAFRWEEARHKRAFSQKSERT